MSGKKIAAVAIPVLVAAVALGVIFTLSGSAPAKSVQDATNNQNSTGQVVPSASEQKCSDIRDRIDAYVVFVDGMGTNETKKRAAETLVEEYCQRPDLIQEMGAMENPALGLVAYGCDAGSGKSGDRDFQNAVSMYGQAYCEGAFVAIYDGAEQVSVSAGDYRDQLQEENDASGNSTGIMDDQSNTRLQEISGLAKEAKSLLDSGQYYSAAKALDSASKMLEVLMGT